MNLRCLWLDPFPAGLKLTREEYRAAESLAHKLGRLRPHVLGSRRRFKRVAMRGTAVLLFALALGASSLLSSVLTFVPAVVFALAVFYVEYWTAIPLIRRALLAMGYDLCIECGYLHTGLDANVRACPECGAARTDNCPRCGFWLGGLDRSIAACPGCDAQVHRLGLVRRVILARPPEVGALPLARRRDPRLARPGLRPGEAPVPRRVRRSARLAAVGDRDLELTALGGRLAQLDPDAAALVPVAGGGAADGHAPHREPPVEVEHDPPGRFLDPRAHAQNALDRAGLGVDLERQVVVLDVIAGLLGDQHAARRVALGARRGRDA